MRTPPPVSGAPGSPAWRSALGLPWRSRHWPPRPLQRSCSSSTCGRLQWVSASEMAYFSTVFKTEATNCTSQRGRQGPTLLYLVLHFQSDTRMPTAWWESGLALRPSAREWGMESPVPALGARREGRAVGAGAGPPEAGLLGGGWFGCGGWLAVEPPETLTLAVTWATLGRSPDLSPGASSRLCSSPLGCWRRLIPSRPATGPHGILTSGTGFSVKGPPVSSSGSPPQEAVPSSDFPH